MFRLAFLLSTFIIALVILTTTAAPISCLKYSEHKSLDDDMKRMFDLEKQNVFRFICEKVEDAETVATYKGILFLILALALGFTGGAMACCCCMKKQTEYHVLKA
uniref:Transmembrane protein n=1 Tax=Panagrolaimus davidi TaxID=227884 RepID=A0A914QLN7_9BILA